MAEMNHLNISYIKDGRLRIYIFIIQNFDIEKAMAFSLWSHASLDVCLMKRLNCKSTNVYIYTGIMPMSIQPPLQCLLN